MPDLTRSTATADAQTAHQSSECGQIARISSRTGKGLIVDAYDRRGRTKVGVRARVERLKKRTRTRHRAAAVTDAQKAAIAEIRNFYERSCRSGTAASGADAGNRWIGVRGTSRAGIHRDRKPTHHRTRLRARPDPDARNSAPMQQFPLSAKLRLVEQLGISAIGRFLRRPSPACRSMPASVSFFL